MSIVEQLSDDLTKYKLTKDKVEQLNSLVEHINNKINGLRRQEIIVEKATEEAGRLNTLTWKIDSDLKHLEQKYSDLNKIEKNISRIESLITESRNGVEDIRRFIKEVEGSAATRIEILEMCVDIKRFAEEFKNNSNEIKKSQQHISEVYTMGKNAKALADTIDQHQKNMENSLRRISEYEKNIELIERKISETDNKIGRASCRERV